MGLVSIFTWGKYKKRNDLRSNFESAIWLKIRELSIARFRYEGLPEGIEPYHIERTLFDQGVIGFTKKGGKLIALPITESSTINMYGDVDEFGLYSSINGLTIKNLKNGKSGVVVKNNLDSVSTMALLVPWVNQLSDIWFGMGINRKNSRNFAIMTGTKDQMRVARRQYNTAMNQEDGLIFFGNNKQFKIEKLDLKIEYTPDKYWDDFNKTWSALLELLGYKNNSVAEKKERVVVDEVNLNSELTKDFMATMLQYRLDGIEKINKLFGTNITIELRQDETEEVEGGDDE